MAIKEHSNQSKLVFTNMSFIYFNICINYFLHTCNNENKGKMIGGGLFGRESSKPTCC